MTKAVPILIAVEGESDKEVAKALVAYSGGFARPPKAYGGKPNLDPTIPKWNDAGRRTGCLVLRDCDHDDAPYDGCRGLLANRLIGGTQSPLFSLRFPVRAVEAWLLADDQGFAAHFRVARSKIPGNPELLHSPKAELLNIIRSSKRKGTQEMLPRQGSGRSVGPEYVPFINEFVMTSWSIQRAAANSQSLSRAIRGVTELVARCQATT